MVIDTSAIFAAITGEPALRWRYGDSALYYQNIIKWTVAVIHSITVMRPSPAWRARRRGAG
jgi:hypothetical protein